MGSTDDQSGNELSLCTLLWISFFREAKFTSTDMEKECIEQWLEQLFANAPNCDEDVLEQAQSFLSSVVEHKLLIRIKEKEDSYPRKPYVRGIAIVDQVVEHLLDARRLTRWQEQVVDGR